ncbi:competence/damage-inducible protein A [Salibacter halophilus]|uniref:CinA-like protein n=1 Tax=Salibacter halophilus TaxID=1803916 RepID=A0A6N6M705_9FLAO|nr:competence/damage-inducible protein A [Salibacter halophilus]KAB1065702.1 competence/damage-inducible protein A [Salibacter halophilus]
MFAEIITIGDEILIGQVIDSNSAWIAKQLNALGIRVRQITSISDDKEHIFNAMNEARKNADLIIMTGGLGPTRDDITKRTFADYFNDELIMNDRILKGVEDYFASKGKEMLDVNKYQALVPSRSKPVQNKNGTAPATWMEDNGQVFISLPGVPYEMKAMMNDPLLKWIKQYFNTPFVYHRTVLTQGMGESRIMGLISKWEDSLEEHNIKLAYLPSPGMVRLRLSATGDNQNRITTAVDKKVKELENLIGDIIFGYGEDTLEGVVGKLLREKGKTLSTAESCTGGYIAHLITSISGSSDYFQGSIVSYSNEVKQNTLGVSSSDIETHGAVSEEVVRQMAEGARKTMRTDFAVATSGVAGPNGGSDQKPVGTVWIAVSSKSGTIAKKYTFGNNRERNIRQSALAALNMLRKEILADT